jgi:hypothetical protein
VRLVASYSRSCAMWNVPSHATFFVATFPALHASNAYGNALDRAAVHSHRRYVVRANTMDERDGRSNAVALMERIVPGKLVHRRNSVPSKTIVPASLRRSIRFAGAVARGLAAIGRAINISAPHHRADSAPA